MTNRSGWALHLGMYRASHPDSSFKDCLKGASATYERESSHRGVEIVSFTLSGTSLDGVALARKIKDFLPGLLTNAAALKYTKKKALNIERLSANDRRVSFVRRGPGAFDPQKFAKSVTHALGKRVTVASPTVCRSRA